MKTTRTPPRGDGVVFARRQHHHPGGARPSLAATAHQRPLLLSPPATIYPAMGSVSPASLGSLLSLASVS